MDSITPINKINTEIEDSKIRSDSIVKVNNKNPNRVNLRSSDVIEPIVTQSSKDFDVQRVYASFVAALRDDKSIGTQEYVYGYKELLKFFDKLGMVFSFVKTDVDGKLDILQKYVDGINKSHFETVQLAMEYEIKTNLLKSTEPPSYSRTLLRLHRALKFIILFLKDLADVPASQSSSKIASSAYEQTLANHHGWVIRNTVKVGLYSLPNRKDLDETIFKGKKPELIAQYHDFIITLTKIYDIVQKIYKEKNLENLA